MSSLGINSLIIIPETGNACMKDSVALPRINIYCLLQMVGYVVLIDLVVEQIKLDESVLEVLGLYLIIFLETFPFSLALVILALQLSILMIR